MIIELEEIKVKDIYEGFHENIETNQVVGYNGKLNIRPKFQREFVYNEDQRKAVIDTVLNGYPLNTMYWSRNNEDENGNEPIYELLDGQQRTLSVMTYMRGDFSYEGKFFHNLPEDIKEKIEEYPFQVYKCYGTESEKLAWFTRINTKGEPLNKQELRNATYTGPWLEDAKKYFSKKGSPAAAVSENYVKGVDIRQDYLETALKYIALRDNTTIEDYMAKHQNDSSASELWMYFKNIISWAQTLFPKKRKELLSQDWGKLYHKYHNNSYDPNKFEKELKDLYLDDEVTNNKGIYEYLFDRKEKHLNLREFTKKQRALMYEDQEGICPKCNEHFEIDKMEADHVTPWSEGGKTELDNGQMLCITCNREKSNK